MTATPIAPVGAVPQTERAGDRQLLARYRAGDRAAAEELVDRTYGRVYGLLVRMSGDPDLAADLTQETYRRAWRSLDRFDGRASVATWLHRIAHNTYLNHRRDNRRIVPLDEERAAAFPSPAPGPDAAASARQRAERLRAALDTLPAELRRVLLARYWSELPSHEIAAAEGVSEVTVRKRVRRGLAALGRVLDGADDHRETRDQRDQRGRGGTGGGRDA